MARCTRPAQRRTIDSRKRPPGGKFARLQAFSHSLYLFSVQQAARCCNTEISSPLPCHGFRANNAPAKQRRQALPSGQRQPNGFSCEQRPSPPDVPRPLQKPHRGFEPLFTKASANTFDARACLPLKVIHVGKKAICMLIRIKRARAVAVMPVFLLFRSGAAAVFRNILHTDVAEMVFAPFEEQQISEKRFVYLFLNKIREQIQSVLCAVLYGQSCGCLLLCNRSGNTRRWGNDLYHLHNSSVYWTA